MFYQFINLEWWKKIIGLVRQILIWIVNLENRIMTCSEDELTQKLPNLWFGIGVYASLSWGNALDIIIQQML